MHRLAELGAYGVTFHDDDLIPFGSSDAERAKLVERFRRGAGRDRAGRADGHHQPLHPPGLQGRRVHRERPGRPPLRAAQGDAQHRPRRRAGRHDVRAVGRPGGRRVATRPRTCEAALDRFKEASTCSASTCWTAATTCGSRSSPSRTSRAATSCCPPSGTRWPSSSALEHPELVGVNPEVGHEQMAGLNFAHGIAQALWAGKLFHIDLNGQHGIKYDQDLRFGAGDLRSAFWIVDLLEGAGGTGPVYTGPRHFDFKPPRTEDLDGVWASAAGCMRNYLILKERAAAFRADPEVPRRWPRPGCRSWRCRRSAPARAGRSCSPPRRRGLRPGGGRRPRHGLRAARPARHGPPARRPLTPGRTRTDLRPPLTPTGALHRRSTRSPAWAVPRPPPPASGGPAPCPAAVRPAEAPGDRPDRRLAGRRARLGGDLGGRAGRPRSPAGSSSRSAA